MPLRSGDHGYGALAKTLHWLTVVALVAQFTIGYRLDVDDSGHGRGRGRGRGGESGRGRGRGGEDDGGYLDDPGTLLTVHVLLGVLILTLAVIRVVVRSLDGLPPWAETLSHRRADAGALDRAGPAGAPLRGPAERHRARAPAATTTCCRCTSARTSPSSSRWPRTSGSCSSTSWWTGSTARAGCC